MLKDRKFLKMSDLDNTVSIIIPCYNNEEFVRNAIDSALNQKYPSIQVIVVDDGSSDHSLNIIRSFGDRIQWESQVNQGAPTARNRGLQLSTGKYVKFLDADDLLLPGSLALQVQQSADIGDGQKAIVYGEAIWVNQHLQPTQQHPLRPRLAGEGTVTHILTACPLTSCPLHKRDYLLEVGGFDVSLPRGQEHDLHLRLALAGVEFRYHSAPVYHYRNYESPGRISNQKLSNRGALVQYNMLKKQQELVEAALGKTMAVSVKQAIARRYWKYGRSVLREGHVAAAKKYFQTAKALDKRCVVGSAPYPTLVKCLGPYLSEGFFSNLKQLKLKFSR